MDSEYIIYIIVIIILLYFIIFNNNCKENFSIGGSSKLDQMKYYLKAACKPGSGVFRNECRAPISREGVGISLDQFLGYFLSDTIQCSIDIADIFLQLGGSGIIDVLLSPIPPLEAPAIGIESIILGYDGYQFTQDCLGMTQEAIAEADVAVEQIECYYDKCASKYFHHLRAAQSKYLKENNISDIFWPDYLLHDPDEYVNKSIEEIIEIADERMADFYLCLANNDCTGPPIPTCVNILPTDPNDINYGIINDIDIQCQRWKDLGYCTTEYNDYLYEHCSLTCNEEYCDPCKDQDGHDIICGQHGTCDEGNCICSDGYTGDNCEIEPTCINDNDRCQQWADDGECNNNPRYMQEHCSLSCNSDYCDPCSNINCGQHGTCDGGNCICSDSYTGNNCEIDPCSNINCGQHGTCDGGNCICSDSYTGNNCEIEPIIDCVGEFSECDSDCIKTYNIVTQASSRGNNCKYNNGQIITCEQGDGNCFPFLVSRSEEKIPFGSMRNDCNTGNNTCFITSPGDESGQSITIQGRAAAAHQNKYSFDGIYNKEYIFTIIDPYNINIKLIDKNRYTTIHFTRSSTSSHHYVNPTTIIDWICPENGKYYIIITSDNNYTPFTVIATQNS